ncbi:MAG: hypothetical protein M3Z25_21835 [Actinomycetota bacterium]|nr:hypothetical protein [Actinomycetota bacterium]
MRRFVFQPRWILGHLLVLAAAVACGWLGDWQWGRAHVTGAAQNWGYAFQWPLFAACFLIGWWRMLRLESLRLDEAGDAAEVHIDIPVLTPVPDPPTANIATTLPADTSTQSPGTPEDERHAAYNRMLAALAAQDTAEDGRR